MAPAVIPTPAALAGHSDEPSTHARNGRCAPCTATSARMLEMYRREHPSFRDALYVAGMCESLWAELDALLG